MYIYIYIIIGVAARGLAARREEIAASLTSRRKEAKPDFPHCLLSLIIIIITTVVVMIISDTSSKRSVVTIIINVRP